MNAHRQARPVRPPRLRTTVPLIVATVVLSSCGGPSPERLQAELGTFPLPSHLVQIQMEASGNSLCLLAECPRASRVYITTRTAEITCGDLRAAIGRWDAADEVKWVEQYEDKDYPCRASAKLGGAFFGLVVFNPDLLLPSQMEKVPFTDRNRLRTAVTLSLDAPAR